MTTGCSRWLALAILGLGAVVRLVVWLWATRRVAR